MINRLHLITRWFHLNVSLNTVTILLQTKVLCHPDNCDNPTRFHELLSWNRRLKKEEKPSTHKKPLVVTQFADFD